MSLQRDRTEIGVFGRGKRCSFCLQPVDRKLIFPLLRQKILTVSLTISQMSADPEFAIGITLISLAS